VRSTLFRLYYFNSKKYRDISLEEFLEVTLAQEDIMLLTSSLTEDIVNMFIQSFNLNPILLWELSLRQQFDKFIQFDEDCILYSVQIHKEYSLTNIALIKLLQIKSLRLTIVITDQDALGGREEASNFGSSKGGFDIVSKIMKKTFQFTESMNPHKRESFNEELDS